MVTDELRLCAPALSARWLLSSLCLLALAAPAAARQIAQIQVSPAPPELPVTISRDAEGRTTVRAVRLDAPLKVDGNLDEDIYRTIMPMSDFVQYEPHGNMPATERTEVWISFDQDNIYVSMRAAESEPTRMIVNEMRRDSPALLQNEYFQFDFDTFYDRRNAVTFQFNPIGGRMDGQVSNETFYNGDWNPIWRLAVRRVPDGGWTAEAAVPFKSLRFKPGQAQIWGFQALRVNRWKNEMSFLTRLSPGLATKAFQQASQYATLVGVDVPARGRALDLKPFVNSNLTSDLGASPQVRNAVGTEVGLDAKYGVTQNLTADFTYNTDFAQVEADEQQVNLSRFSLFFPEKRDFFLENHGVFTFASGLGNISNGNHPDTPTLFYTRRIGLDHGHEVPIEAGGRLSGRVGRYSLGLLNIQTGGVGQYGIPSANFGVARIKRDILRRSTIGALVTRRSRTSSGTGAAETFGLDAGLAFFRNLYFNLFWGRTPTPDHRGDDQTYRMQSNYNADRYGLIFERLRVGDNFDPQVGFLRRDNFLKSRVQARFSPRPVRMKAVRKFSYSVAAIAFRNGAGEREALERSLDFSAEFQTSDRLQLTADPNVDVLAAPFTIARNVIVPPGRYSNTTAAGSFFFGQQRHVSGLLTFEAGSFYGGTRRALTYNAARVNLSQHLAVEPGASFNRVRLPYGDFTAGLASARATYTVTPLMFASGLVQYNSSTNSFSTNVRFRWEYQPGSEVFLVYNDSRDTLQPGLGGLQNRALVFKINRLFRF